MGKNSPSITTTLSATNVSIGTAVHDTAKLSGATGNAGGTVTYNVYAGASTCTGSTVKTFSATVTNGVVGNSGDFTPGAAGTYSWQAVYSGDANNNGATSGCSDEQLIVQPNSPSITTTLSASTAAIGTAVHDSSTLSGATGNAGGSVTYSVYAGANTCSGTALQNWTVTVTNGLVPNSGNFTPSAAGTYSWQAIYGGDANNNGAISACTEEQLLVNANPTSTTTQVQTVNGNSTTNLATGGTAAFGSTVHDTAALSGATANAGGTVTYTLYSGTTCTSNALVKSWAVNVTNGVVPASGSIALTTAGAYGFQAVYSGDANNVGSSSACGSEAFNIAKIATAIATTPQPASGAVGVAIADVAKVSGGSNPGGTVTFALYGPGDTTCSSNLIDKLAAADRAKFVNVPMSGGSATSGSYTTTDVGVYQWVASYSGDPNNLGSAGACGDTTEQVVTAAVLAEVSLPPTGSIPIVLMLIGFPLMAIGLALRALGRRRRA